MAPKRNITEKFTKKFDSKVINRQYFHRKTGLQGQKEKNPAPQLFNTVTEKNICILSVADFVFFFSSTY